jgi:hypothetical protein
MPLVAAVVCTSVLLHDCAGFDRRIPVLGKAAVGRDGLAFLKVRESECGSQKSVSKRRWKYRCTDDETYRRTHD